MFKTINGYTKALMIKAINERNLGAVSGDNLFSDDAACMYRTELNSDYNHCAVGVFIPDSYFQDPKFENTVGLKSLLKTFPELNNHMPLDMYAMMKLQGIHDNFANLEDWRDPRPALINWVECNVVDA